MIQWYMIYDICGVCMSLWFWDDGVGMAWWHGLVDCQFSSPHYVVWGPCLTRCWSRRWLMIMASQGNSFKCGNSTVIWIGILTFVIIVQWCPELAQPSMFIKIMSHGLADLRAIINPRPAGSWKWVKAPHTLSWWGYHVIKDFGKLRVFEDLIHVKGTALQKLKPAKNQNRHY